MSRCPCLYLIASSVGAIAEFTGTILSEERRLEGGYVLVIVLKGRVADSSEYVRGTGES